jgi:hypothetical protein
MLLCAVIYVRSDVSVASGYLPGHKNLLIPISARSTPILADRQPWKGPYTSSPFTCTFSTVDLWMIRSRRHFVLLGISSVLLPYHGSDWLDFTQLSHITDVLLFTQQLNIHLSQPPWRWRQYFTPKRLNTHLQHQVEILKKTADWSTVTVKTNLSSSSSSISSSSSSSSTSSNSTTSSSSTSSLVVVVPAVVVVVA